MLATGTADRDHQLVLALFYVIRDQKLDHVYQFVQKDMGLLVAHHKLLDLNVIAGLGSEFRDIVWIWQKTHIKD